MPDDISGSITVGGHSFDYNEIKQNPGGGPRGITISLKGVSKSKYKFYEITPNPHENGKYNAGGQAKFYAAIAQHIAHGFTFTADDVTSPYAAVPSSPGDSEMAKLMANALGATFAPKGKKWNQLTKEQQKSFLATYKTKWAEDRKSREATQKAKAWTDHVKTKNGTSVSWESTSYKLPTAVSVG